MGHKWAAFLQQPHIVHGNVGVGGLSATVRMVGAQSFVNIGTGGDVDRSRHLKVKRRGSNWNWRSELFFQYLPHVSHRWTLQLLVYFET